MSRYYGPTDADALVPDLVTVASRLREQRAELVALRDAFRSREGDLAGDLAGSPARDDTAADDPLAGVPAPEADDPELRRLRLRMRGIVDQMAADVAWLDERDIVLRDIATGLLDFPALAAGRQVWLCWRLGEDRVAFWHSTDEGFAGRKPLDALPHGVAHA